MKLSSKLALLLVALQIADAVLTGWGVHLFGIHVEANPLVKHAMILLGTVGGLVLVKMFAICGIALLWMTNSANIMLFLSGIYTGVVIMWVLAFCCN